MNYSFELYRKRDRNLKKCHLDFIIKFLNKQKTRKNIEKNSYKERRYLEIGPGLSRIEGFETLNIIDGRNVDYIMNIAEPLDFEDNTFDIIYASHVIEHIPWFMQRQLFNELYRILKPGGVLEVWVPDFGKVLETVNSYLSSGTNNTSKDGWYRYNSDKDVFTWANGRIFSYGDGDANPISFNWHRCVFHSEFLEKLFLDAHFVKVERMTNEQVRGYDHGWINLGIKGCK